MTEFEVPVVFTVHGTSQENAEDRLAQRLEVARLVRPAGTPPEPGMVERYYVLNRKDLYEGALDRSSTLVRGITGEPLVDAIETEVSEGVPTPDGDTTPQTTGDVSTVRPELSGEAPPAAHRGPEPGATEST